MIIERQNVENYKIQKGGRRVEEIKLLIGDFLKNAGLVGLKYLLDASDAEEEIDYGITEDKQGLWLDRQFVVNADWTDMYFKAFVKRYEELTNYQVVLDKIGDILEKAGQPEWDKKTCKEDLKFINEKMLSNSYQSGFANMKDQIENPDVYELLKSHKLKENMEKEELCARLRQLTIFLQQPLCKETFSMKSIIYNYINRFWDGKSFLLRANASKNMKSVFDVDFSEPFRRYAAADHKKAKDMCIDCDGKIDAKEKVSIAFMKDQADDLTRKRSAFWNCKVDAYLCPACAFVYSLAPLGFTLAGRTFVFVNMNQNIDLLLQANSPDGKMAVDLKRKEKDRYSSWIAGTINLLLQEKDRELGNIQVIARGMGESDRYTFDVISKDILKLLNDKSIRNDLEQLGRYPYVKTGREYWNVHETVILNLLRYHNQYEVIGKLLKMALEGEGFLFKASFVYDVQLRSSLARKKDKAMNTGGEVMNRYAVRERGYELRNALLGAKGTSDDACIRGTIYQLLNALSVGNVEHFMEVIMRVYCSTRLQVPDAFIEFLKDRDTFTEYGYAFLLGLQGSHYEKKEEKVNG
jgi:CRISPR-associated protein Cst1